MKLLAIAAVALAISPAAAQRPQGIPAPTPIASPAQPGAIPLYPMMKVPATPVERWMAFGTHRVVRNVAVPTITPFLPSSGKATGAAVIVAPGGGFMHLAMDTEGFATARWLADHGIAAFLLKYRVIETPDGHADALAFMDRRMAEAMKNPAGRPTISEPRSTEDGLAALQMVRGEAAKWGVDPTRVGMMGFSAGAMLTMSTALAAKPAERPAFIGYIYGPMLPIAVPADAPPMFAAIAMDDALFRMHGLGLIEAWNKAARPVEFHAYERGGHGFGIGKPGTTTSSMMPQFRDWLAMRGLLGKPQ